MRRIRRCSTWLWSYSLIVDLPMRVSSCRRPSPERVRLSGIFPRIQPNTVLPWEKNPTGAILAAARVSHRPRRDFLAGETILSLLLDGIEGFAPGLPCFEVPSASRSTHPCSPDHPHAPQIPGMGCSPPHIALLSGLEGTGMTGRQITDVMSSIAIQFGQVPGRLLPRCK